MEKTIFRIFIPLAVIAAGLVYLASCDKIDEPYTKTIATTDTAACPAPDFPGLTSEVKRVLLEDYTGHLCVNCPAAAIIAQNLKETHPGRVVLLAVHAGSFAVPTASGKYTYDFRSPAGTEWDSYFGISSIGNPNGLVNRKSYQNNLVLSPAAWSGAISEALSGQPEIGLQMINEYDSTERKLCTHIKTSFITELDRDLKLVVVLTESGIVQPQRNTDPNAGAVPEIPDYEFNHVLRAAINSTWGSVISTAGSANPESIVKSYKYILDEKYIAGNCSVVAFIYDNDTKEVLQAVESPVTGD